MKENDKIILETDRFYLAEWLQSDLTELKTILQDDETMWAYDKTFDEEACEKWLQWNLESYHKHGFGLWKIVDKQTGEVVGQCGLTWQKVEDEWYPEIGYHIKKEFWQQGFATEVGTAVRDYGFNERNFKEIAIIVGENNIPSMNTAIKLGFNIKKQFTLKKPRPHYLFTKRMH